MVYEFLYHDRNQKKCWFHATGQSVYTIANFIQNKQLKTEYIRGNNTNKTIVVELYNDNDFMFPSYEEGGLFYLILQPEINQQLLIKSVKPIYKYISQYNRVDLSKNINDNTWKMIFPMYNSIPPVYPSDEDEYDDYFHDNIDEYKLLDYVHIQKDEHGCEYNSDSELDSGDGDVCADNDSYYIDTNNNHELLISEIINT